MAPLAKIRCEQAFCLDFHPTRPLLAAALITGQLKLYDCAQPRPRRHASARPHKGACRAARFSADGASIFSGGSDTTLQQRDVETNARVWGKRAAHPAPINALRLIGDTGVASGDDDGLVRVWDVRQRASALEFTEHSEMITDLLYTDRGKCLVSASTDGYLAVYDLRRGRLDARSDNQEDELLCLALLKGGKKLVCGTQEGVVGIWSWGSFGDVSDRLLGHAASVDAVVPFDDSTLLTGGADGKVSSRASPAHLARISRASRAHLARISCRSRRCARCRCCPIRSSALRPSTTTPSRHSL